MGEEKSRKLELQVNITGTETAQAIYANHSMININPYDANILFSYVDGLDVANAVIDGRPSKRVNGKAVAKLVMSHRAAIELARGLGKILDQIRKDSLEEKSGE